MIEGNATSGGAIGASASVLTFKNIKFTGNRASVYGGALFLSGGSNVSIEGPTQFVGNSAFFGGAMFVKEVSWPMSLLFSRNSAASDGGTVFFTSGSSGVWLGRAYFTRNTVFYRGGALYVVDGSDVLWTEETDFWENQACGFGISGQRQRCLLFNGNKAWYSGGAIYVSSGSVVGWAGPTELFRNTMGAYFTVDRGDYSSWSTSLPWSRDCVLSGP